MRSFHYPATAADTRTQQRGAFGVLASLDLEPTDPERIRASSDPEGDGLSAPAIRSLAIPWRIGDPPRLMLFKLTTSIALFALGAFAIVQALDGDPTAPLIAVFGLLAGYHRNLTTPDGSIPFFRVVTATSATPKVRYTIWGIPLAPAARVRISERGRNRAVNAPVRTFIIECLPAGLRWFIRKVSA